MSTAPEFIAGREPVERAWEYAEGIYSAPGLEQGAGIEHPIAVAELVAGAGFDDDAVAAALLHDIVEDSTATPDEIASRFGPEVAKWVEILTEDISIADYHERKEEHRRRPDQRGDRGGVPGGEAHPRPGEGEATAETLVAAATQDRCEVRE